MQSVTVASGLTVSSEVTLAGHGPLAIWGPSAAANQVFVAFTEVRDVGGPYGRLLRDDGTGTDYTVFSGSGAAWGLVQHPPTPFLRIELATAATDTRTIGLYALNRP